MRDKNDGLKSPQGLRRELTQVGGGIPTKQYVRAKIALSQNGYGSLPPPVVLPLGLQNPGSGGGSPPRRNGVKATSPSERVPQSPSKL